MEPTDERAAEGDEPGLSFGDRIQLRFRPVSGRGVIDGATDTHWRVRLDDGTLMFATSGDLIPEDRNP